MRRLLLAMMTLAAVISMAAPVSAQTVGVVLMHGNTDTPSGTIASLAAALEGAGYPVERPEMCWSYRRRRDRPLLDCLSELEAPIERLSGRGVRAIVVAGMSVGGLGAVEHGEGDRIRPGVADDAAHVGQRRDVGEASKVSRRAAVRREGGGQHVQAGHHHAGCLGTAERLPREGQAPSVSAVGGRHHDDQQHHGLAPALLQVARCEAAHDPPGPWRLALQPGQGGKLPGGAAGQPGFLDERAVAHGDQPVRGGRDPGIVGDHDQGLPGPHGGCRTAAAPPGSPRCRGCRWARRPARRAGRWPGHGRSRPAGAGPRTAPTAGTRVRSASPTRSRRSEPAAGRPGVSGRPAARAVRRSRRR